jgi:cyclophilin family peptidyl-prolyl cis-trans isomerase/protein-disulfide isomerase
MKQRTSREIILAILALVVLGLIGFWIMRSRSAQKTVDNIQATPSQSALAQTTSEATAAQPTHLPATVVPASFTPAPISCVVISRIPTPSATESSLFPPPSSADWSVGPDTASVTFMEYSDFQCPYCAMLATVLTQLHQAYPDEVRVIFRHFPLPAHDKSLLSAQAAEAAGKQGKFMEMYDFLFAQQNTWSIMSVEDFNSWLKTQAPTLGLNGDQFNADLTNPEIVMKITQAQQEGQKVGIPGTPFILINGKPYQGPRDLENLTAIVKLFDLQKRQFEQCPPMTIDESKQYVATIKTQAGDVVVRLFADKAPFTVNSFIFLAKNGWYDGVPFHRVLPGFVAQAGDPSGTGFGSPGYAYSNEIFPGLNFDKPGLLGMANAGPNSNGSQFFITFAPTPDLNGSYTIFGEVIQGMDVVRALTPRDPDKGGDLPPGTKIIGIAIQEQ